MAHPLQPQPGMRYSFWHPAGTTYVPGKGEFPNRFAPHAFDSQIGKTVPQTLKETEDSPGVPTGWTATVIAVEVAEDGSGAEFTVELQPASGKAHG